MKKFEPKDLRTLALVGHGKCGKTSLGEAFLYDAKAVTRLGSVDDETSVLDTEPEELKRKSSISCAVGYCEWEKCKITFVDTPGDSNFAADSIYGLTAAGAAVVVVSAPDGVQVGTEKAWDLTKRAGIPRTIFINKLDRERADFDKALAECKEILSNQAVPLQIPIGKEQQLSGVVDLLHLKAYTFADDGRTVNVGDVPADLEDEAAAAREQLIEGIASSDDALMEKYLETMELSEEEIHKGLAGAILAGTIVPVLCGSATRNVGVQPLMDLIVKSFPSPLQRPPSKGKDQKGNEIERKWDGPFSGFIFKTITADVGKIALMRVLSGTLSADATVLNASTDNKERCGQLYALNGKKRESLEQAVAGDIVGLAKLKDAQTGHTLCEERDPVVYAAPELPEPVIGYSIHPLSKGDEEKVATKLHDIMNEDVGLRLERDQTTKEMLLRGLGQIHIDTTVDKLRRMGVEVELAEPKVPYREAIKGKATHVEGKHKKQSGGRGQFGVCYFDMEPKPKDSEVKEDPLEFVNAIFGGAIPKQFIPAIEKGIRTRMSRGVIAGYPVVDIKVTLKDGKYHPVDSDGRSFEMAGSKGFQAATKQATPILLEPIVELEVTCPEDNMGDIMGDVSSRRGKVMGTEAKGRNQIIRAQVPMAEVLRYAIDLESMTAGRGSFSVSPSHYEEVPGNLAEKIIADAKVAEDED